MKNEISVRVNLTLPPSVLDSIDKNIDKMKSWLLRHGADEKEINKVVSRSGLLREMAEVLATETGYHSMLAGFSLALGVEDNGQQELFKD